MSPRTWIYIFGAVFILTLNSCASGQKSDDGFFGGVPPIRGPFAGNSPLFEDPPEKTLFSDEKIFDQALVLHKKGQAQPAVQLWKDFLQQQPKSFEAHNNLGMAYYSNNDLDNAVQSFKTALELKPFDEKIEGNLIRVLRFRSTLARENKEYPKAVADLQTMVALVAPDKKEKILKEIEQQQDIIYKQVEQTNSLAAYENFANEYPNSIFAEKAKSRMAELSSQTAGRKEFESGRELGSPPPQKQPVEPESIPEVIPPPPSVKGNLAEEKATEDSSLEPMRKIKIAAGTSADEVEDIPSASPATTPPGRAHKVKITTKHSRLNVRKSPSTKSPVIGKVGRGTVHSILEEKGGWFHIVYSKGKTTGWISKKYSQVVK